jgi:hypothetical protein
MFKTRQTVIKHTKNEEANLEHQFVTKMKTRKRSFKMQSISNKHLYKLSRTTTKENIYESTE